jgi:molybdate transport system substrate-binding protein
MTANAFTPDETRDARAGREVSMKLILAKSLVAGLLVSASVTMVSAAEIRVVTVGALRNPLQPIAADFTKASGHQANVTYTNPAMLKQVLAEGKFDVIIAAVPAVEEIEKAGGLQAGTRVKAGRVGIGVSVRAGTPKPDVATPDAFKQAVTKARNIVYTDPAPPTGSGVVTMRILTAAGLVDMVKGKGRQEGLGPGKELIAKGEYEMGFFNVSEAEAPGVVLAGPVPGSLQQYTVYDAAVLAGTSAKDAASAFIKYVTDKAAAERWKAGGAELP